VYAGPGTIWTQMIMDSDNFLQWRLDYSIGIQEIDNQHRELIQLINDLLKICREDTTDENYESFNRLVAIILEHFHKHFEAEEKLMLEKKYPRYEEHKKRHDKLIEDIKKMMDKIVNEKQKMSLINMVIFLREWFVENIYIMDKQMGEYFNSI
jgi:hemerythrin